MSCRVFLQGKKKKKAAAKAAPAAAAKPAAAAAAASTGGVKVYGTSGKYATGLFNVAKEQKVLKQVQDDLPTLREVFKTEHVRVILLNPTEEQDEQLKVLNELLPTLGLHKVTQEFGTVLFATKALDEMDDIVRDFNKLVDHELKLVHGTVTSAEPLTTQQYEKIVARMQGTLEKGQTLVVSQRVNAQILGGLIVRVGEVEQDLSISTRLDTLEQGLNTM
jgi:ATP synthase F1 delta subunit